jgi:3-oxoacyl-[acyl-carrier-protein] synthase III
MSGTTILGTGRYLPGAPVSNHELARVMDTSDAWIRQRSGITQRHFARDGEGASDLAVEAARRALQKAGIAPKQVGAVIFNTMTPDSVLPGPAALFAHKLGLSGVPAFDLRQQCAAVPFSMVLADALIARGIARYVLIACAETHAGLMPWKRWDVLSGQGERDDLDFERASQHRGVAVLFGDGAGALVVGPSSRSEAGLLGAVLESDGESYDALRIDHVGFSRRGLVDSSDPLPHVPRMRGSELFKNAVQRLPGLISRACAPHVASLDEVDWFVAHQANDRINRAVREALGVDPDRVPSNIARYGNTSSATIPILMDELFEAEKLAPGQRVCVFALGAGLHLGALLLRL